MYTRLKERFGTAGVVLGIIALILALGGTALAAKGALTGKQKKEVEKIAKKFAGKPGAPGTAGANGAPGKDGSNGTNGAPGAAGKSVTTSVIAAGGECGTGVTGTKFEVEGSGSPSHVCSGKAGVDGDKGEKGDPGSPWTLGTLPSGATETGVYSAKESPGLGTLLPLLFPVPLAENLEEDEVHFSSDPDFVTFCKGNANEPSPEPGQLCVYYVNAGTGLFEGIFRNPEGEVKGTHTAGAYLSFGTASSSGFVAGVFAVQAP